MGEVARDGIAREHDVVIRQMPLAPGSLEVRARIADIGNGTILVLVEDLSGARRTDAVRRDFITNVSHGAQDAGGQSLVAVGGCHVGGRRS